MGSGSSTERSMRISPPRGGTARNVKNVTYKISSPSHTNAFEIEASGAKFRPLKTGYFKFSVQADDEATVNVGDVKFEGKWVRGGDGSGTATNALMFAGTDYPISISAKNVGGPAKLKFPDWGTFEAVNKPRLGLAVSRDVVTVGNGREESEDGPEDLANPSEVWIGFKVDGGEFGGTLEVETTNFDKLGFCRGKELPTTPVKVPAHTRNSTGYRYVGWYGCYHGVKPSDAANDIVVVLKFTENVTGQVYTKGYGYSATKTLTCVQASGTATTVSTVNVSIGNAPEGAVGSFTPVVDDLESSVGAFVPYQKDVPVEFSCKPENLSASEKVTVKCTGPGQLYEIVNGKRTQVTERSYTANGIENRKFVLHGSNVSSGITDGSITIKASSGKADVAKYTVCDLHLKAVSFSGDKCHVVTKDDGSGPYTAPHWQDNSSPLTRALNGNATDNADRACPVCFTRNTKMKVSATWVMVPSLADEAWAEKKIKKPRIMIHGKGPGGLDFDGTEARVIGCTLTVRKSDGTEGSVKACGLMITRECKKPFDDKVAIYDPMEISWSVVLNADGNDLGTLDGGKSRNQVYVTLGDPKTTVYHTLVHLGCKSAAGETTPEGCTEKIWKVFARPNESTCPDVRRVDGTQLTYYKSYNCSVISGADLLKYGDGQCTAWAEFFARMRSVQGLAGNEGIVIAPKADEGFIVNNWNFSGNERRQYINICKSDNDLVGNTGYNWLFAEVTDAEGISGQGNSNPASLFDFHWVVRLNGKYYDPSYGVKYDELQDIDNAIAGFWQNGYYEMDEQEVNADLNGDGDTDDTNVSVFVYLIKKNKKNPSGLLNIWIAHQENL